MREFELVVPAYNECLSLPALIDQTIKAAEKAQMTCDQFQLVIVDNGSTDGTAQFFRTHADRAKKKWYRVVSVAQNRGYGAGIAAGLATTTASIIGYSHADLQCDPSDGFRAFELCKAGGPKTFIRSRRNGRARKERLVSQIFAIAARLGLNLKADEINAQPKVFRRGLLPHLTHAPTDFAFDLFVLYTAVKSGYHLSVLQVDFPPRQHGTSKWATSVLARYGTFAKMVGYMWHLRKASGPA